MKPMTLENREELYALFHERVDLARAKFYPGSQGNDAFHNCHPDMCPVYHVLVTSDEEFRYAKIAKPTFSHVEFEFS